MCQIMKRNNLPFIAAILFFVCITLLLVYLLGMRLYSPLPTAVFWVLVITAISAMVFQIARVPWPGYEPLLVVEILMFSIILHMIHLVPHYGFSGFDSLRNLMVVRETIEQGMLSPDRLGAASIAAWPLLHMWSAELHFITGITPRNIAMWFPSLVISSLFALLFYISMKRVFKSKQVALLAMLLMVTILYFTFSGAIFKQEFFALVMMMAVLYFLTKTQVNNKTRFAVLSILCLAGVIFSHHLTAFLLLLLLIVWLITNRLLDILGGKWLASPKKATLGITGIFTLLTFIGVFAYQIYINESLLSTLISLSRDLLYGEQGVTLAETAYVVNPQVIITTTGQITFWGYYLFHTVFAIILLRGLLSRSKERFPEFYSLILLLFVYGVWALVQLYLLNVRTAGVVTVERLLMLGWIWGLAPLVICVLESKPRWGKQLGIIVLAAFMVFNVYMIPPVDWDFQASGRMEGHVVLREDYALAKTLALTGEGGTFKMTGMAIYDVQGYYSPYYHLGKVGPEYLETFNWIAIKKKELEAYVETGNRLIGMGRPFSYNMDMLNELEEMIIEDSSQSRDRIYDSNNLAVFK